VRKVFYGCANPRFGGNGSIVSVNRVACCSTPRRRERSDEELTSPAPGVEPAVLVTQSHAFFASLPALRDGHDGGQLAGYPSEALHRAPEAIALLQRFYDQENPAAPAPKKKHRTANAGTASSAIGSA
jgi:tRNA-specific adenosine deaminase 2